MRRFVGTTVITLAVAGCGSIPALGPVQALNVDVPDLGKVLGCCSTGAEGEAPTWSDCISSGRVLPGLDCDLSREASDKGQRAAERGHAEPPRSAWPVRQGQLQ